MSITDSTTHPKRRGPSGHAYHQEEARQYRLGYDPTGLFGGGSFNHHDLHWTNKRLQSWLVEGMLFRNVKTGRVYRVTAGRLELIDREQYEHLLDEIE